MLDFGFPELLVIVAVAVIVIGPQEIPAVMVAIGRLVRRLNYMRFAVSRQFDEFMNDADMGDVADQVNFSRQMSRAPKDAGFDEAAEDAELASENEVETDEQEEGSDDKKSS